MKISIISTYAPKGMKHANAGGVASYTKNLATNLPKKEGDEIFVLCNKIEGRVDTYLEDGLNIVRCFDKTLKCFIQLYKQIKKIKPDVIHIHQELSLFGGIVNAYLLQWFIFALRGYKTVITIHGVVSLKSIDKEFIKGNNSNLPIWVTKLAFRMIYSPLCFWSGKVIVHEEYFKNILISEYGAAGEKIQVIHHGVEDLHVMDMDQSRAMLDIPMSKHLCLFMGYLTGYKGIDLLIEGFAEFAKHDQEAFLVIGAGKHPKLKNDATYLNEYHRLVDKAKLLIPTDQYRWVGFIEESDIVKYYSACDVVLFPYSAVISSSGPMAIAIGYGKLFLASSVFNGILPKELIFGIKMGEFSSSLEMYFRNQDEYFQLIDPLRESRLWNEISKTTLICYQKAGL